MAVPVELNAELLAFDDRASSIGADDFHQEILAPVIAGAFARGVAETFNGLGMPALLLDQHGRVLFASTAAGAYLQGPLAMRAGHLLAKSRADNRTLAQFVAEVLGNPGGRQVATLETAGMTLTAMPVPGASAPVDQLLHAVVVLSRTPA